MATEKDQIVTAITGGAIIGGMIYGRSRDMGFWGTFGIAVLFGFVGYVGAQMLEDNTK